MFSLPARALHRAGDRFSQRVAGNTTEEPCDGAHGTLRRPRLAHDGHGLRLLPSRIYTMDHALACSPYPDVIIFSNGLKSIGSAPRRVRRWCSLSSPTCCNVLSAGGRGLPFALPPPPGSCSFCSTRNRARCPRRCLRIGGLCFHFQYDAQRRGLRRVRPAGRACRDRVPSPLRHGPAVLDAALRWLPPGAVFRGRRREQAAVPEREGWWVVGE